MTKQTKGYCPTCHAPITHTKNERAVCAAGHRIKPEEVQSSSDPVLVTGFGDDPISRDLGIMHMNTTDKLRAAIANIGIKSPGKTSSVIAVSIISAGDAVEDQLIVYSPGGSSEKNARALLKRLKTCVQHVEHVLDNKSFDKF